MVLLKLSVALRPGPVSSVEVPVLKDTQIKQMKQPKQRFSDEQKRLSDFWDEVWVVCPVCAKKAIAIKNKERLVARLTCTACGYAREVDMQVAKTAILDTGAHAYFDAALWLQSPFKGRHVFMALNGAHLEYLERYIAAEIREHAGRSHFTLLEKLPKFYHAAENRAGLLQLIRKLKEK